MKLYLAQVLSREPTRSILTGGVWNYILQDYVLRRATNCYSQTQRERESMNLYFAGEHTIKNGQLRYTGGGWHELCVLESFYYVRKNQYFPLLYEKGVDLLLDSGAFTYMMSDAKVDWDAYIEAYAEFINHYDIQKFFELDIDSLVGLQEVERLRAKLEALTKRKCIPVWHVSRGLDYYKHMCKEYDYVAVGGYVSKDVPRDKFEKAFPALIKIAHENRAKVHGLGYTPINLVQKPFRFDSVDSTAWIAGNRFGAIYRFNAYTGLMEKFDKPEGKRVKNMETAWNNFNEWVKYQQYLKRL